MTYRLQKSKREKPRPEVPSLRRPPPPDYGNTPYFDRPRPVFIGRPPPPPSPPPPPQGGARYPGGFFHSARPRGPPFSSSGQQQDEYNRMRVVYNPSHHEPFTFQYTTGQSHI